MAAAVQAFRPLSVCSRCMRSRNVFSIPIRTLSTASPLRATAEARPAESTFRSPLVPTDQLDPNTVTTMSEEQRLMKKRGIKPIGSRRRRVVLATTKNIIPFEQLPYQCFQEARKYLAEDRAEKVEAIEKMRTRIASLEAEDAAVSGGEPAKQQRLRSMRKKLAQLKILADINDPMVKKKFEDGLGDMNKPIYRFLADRKWRAMKRKVLMQRLTQMHVFPDVLPEDDVVLDIDLIWHDRIVPPGDFVPSTWSEHAPALRIKKFDQGEVLLTIVAVDADMPNLETDGFDSRCVGIWTNISITPTTPDVGVLATSDANSSTTIIPWSVPFAQKGSPYHRIALLAFKQPDNKRLSAADRNVTPQANELSQFSARDYRAKLKLKLLGATMFRTKWDDTMADVMQRNGIEGWDVELRRKKPESLPQKYKVKNGLRYRGWRK